MKRILVCGFVCGLTCMSGNLYGQSIKDILNSSTVKEAVSTLTDKKNLTTQDLQGKWLYLNSACQLKSDNILKGAGGSLITSQIEKKIDNACSKAGITQGTFSYTFNSDSTFTNTIAKGKPLNGTYTLDPETKILTLRYAVGKKLTITTLEATVRKNDNCLTLLFNADKLLKLLSMVSASSSNTTLKAINKLADEYDGVMLGFDMTK